MALGLRAKDPSDGGGGQAAEKALTSQIMLRCLTLLLSLLLLTATGLAADEAEPEATDGGKDWAVTLFDPPLSFEGALREGSYQALAKAQQPWRLCALYPHLKDAYWLSVNFGMVEEASRLGVALQVLEAGGYPNLERQREQFGRCLAEGANAIMLGTVSFEGMTDLVQASPVPVVATVNDIDKGGIAAMSGVSWREMGRTVGAYLAERHPKGSPPVKVAWFPGPEGAGWVTFVQEGFLDGLSESAVEVVVTKWGDTGREIQHILVEEALEDYPGIDYLVGSAVTAEAAIGLLRARGLTEEIGVVADYFTHGVYRGIKRGTVLAAPTDHPVLQGRLAVDMAVRLLEDRLEVQHAGPAIEIVDPVTLDKVRLDESLAPAWFKPQFLLEPAEVTN